MIILPSQGITTTHKPSSITLVKPNHKWWYHRIWSRHKCEAESEKFDNILRKTVARSTFIFIYCCCWGSPLALMAAPFLHSTEPISRLGAISRVAWTARWIFGYNGQSCCRKAISRCHYQISIQVEKPFKSGKTWKKLLQLSKLCLRLIIIQLMLLDEP